MNVLNFLRIISIFHLFKNGYTRSSSVFLNSADAKDAPSGSNCSKPEDNDVIYHSCLDGPYPSNRTKCRCSSDYDQFIYLVCDTYNTWVQDSTKPYCTDELNSKTDPVNIEEATASHSNGQCNKPREKAYFFHSCDKSGYPKSSTECYCSNNYPKKVNLTCYNKQWYTGNWKNQCRGDNKETKAIVRLDDYWYVSRGTCKQPEEQLNYFHSCDNKNYPTNVTSCNCNSDKTKKIDLICRDSVWYRHGSETPCKLASVVLLLDEVRCYKDPNSNKVKCNCLKNCFPFDIEKSLTHQKIYETCYSRGPFLVESQDVDNPLKMYYDNQTNTMKFNCSLGIVNGPEQLSCQNGILNSSLPKCEYAKEVYCKEETNCYCRSNCFQLNLTEELNFEQIPFLCQKTNVIQHFQDKHLISFFDNSTGNLTFICDRNDNELAGSNELACINGNLSGGILPTCSARSKTKTVELGQYKLFNTLACVFMLIFLIFSIFMVYLYCNQKTKLKKYLEQKENTNQGKRDEQLNQEYEEIDEFKNNVERGTNEIAENEAQYEEVDAVRLNNRPEPEYMDMNINEQPDLPERPVSYADARPLSLEAENGYLEPRLPPPEYEYIAVVK